MLKNYAKIALRNLLRYKSYTILNISSLSIGIACFIMLMLYVHHELSYDRFHVHADRIYRMAEQNTDKSWASIAAPIAPDLRTEYPEILYARLWPWQHYLMRYQGQSHYENVFFADASIFHVFSFPLIEGDANSALQAPNTIVISERMALKYFGNSDPIGKTLTFDNQRDLKVSGILKNVPSNSHFKFDCLVSFSTLENAGSRAISRKRSHNFYTYLLLPQNFSPQNLSSALNNLAKRYYGEDSKLSLQPLTAIHLHSHFENEIEPNSDVMYVYIFSSIAVLILFISSINFTNLTTAGTIGRAKEIGIRKVMGSSRSQLIQQFLGESILTTFLAVILASGLVDLCLPSLNLFSDKEMGFRYGFPQMALFSIFSVVIIGIAAGLYPAFFLSRFEPNKVIKVNPKTQLGGTRFRKILVVIQFSISIILISGTSIVYGQLNYIRSKKLGYNKEQVIVLPISSITESTYRSIKNEVLRFPEFSSITISDCIPGVRFTTTTVHPEGTPHTTQVPVRVVEVGYDFLKTLGIELIEGRDFSETLDNGEKPSALINQAAMTRFGWASGQNQKIKWSGGEKQVIGVVKDFHFASFHHPIEPLVFVYEPTGRLAFISIRLHTENMKNALRLLKEKWQSIAPGLPFEYTFLDEYFDHLHRSEERMERLLFGFSIIAILIACLGLFGLTSFTLQQRTKEIGIRKILGATTTHIVILFSKDYVKLVTLASLIACPIAYAIMDTWLSDFSYRIAPGFGVFACSAIAALIIATITVNIRSYKAARANPVDTLRYE